MPRGPKGEKRPAGTIECAHEVFLIATGEKEDKLPSGRVRSGKAGAAARMNVLSSNERTEAAKKAAQARWNKERA